jgi:UDP-arabinose 4-epimerase
VGSVVHFAASAYVGDSMRDPSAYYRNNLLTTLSLLDAMRTAEVDTLLFSSSCSVYGDPVHVPVDESHRTSPMSPYAQTKLDGENALRWYAQAHGLKWSALRYFNAAGADPEGELGEDHDPETRLVPRAVMAAMGTGPALKVFGQDYATADGTAVRDYVHVSDLAQAHVLALRRLLAGAPSAVLNLGTGKGDSVLEVIRAVERVAGRPVPYELAPRRAGDPAAIVADAALAERVLAWQPRHSDIDTIVETAWRWHARARAGIT